MVQLYSNKAYLRFLALTCASWSVPAHTMSCRNAFDGAPATRSWHQKLSAEEIENLLETAKVLGVEPLEDYLEFLGKQPAGTSPRHIVFLEGGLEAVFKPEDELRGSYGEVQMADLLHFSSGQWDRHMGNYLIGDDGHLIAIDNADAYSQVQWRPGQYVHER